MATIRGTSTRATCSTEIAVCVCVCVLVCVCSYNYMLTWWLLLICCRCRCCRCCCHLTFQPRRSCDTFNRALPYAHSGRHNEPARWLPACLAVLLSCGPAVCPTVAPSPCQPRSLPTLPCLALLCLSLSFNFSEAAWVRLSSGGVFGNLFSRRPL